MLGYLGKLIIAKGFKKLPNVQKSPDLVTLLGPYLSVNILQRKFYATLIF